MRRATISRNGYRPRGSREHKKLNQMSKQKIQTVPSENNFALSKVKILKNGGLDVHYEVTEVKGSEAYTTKYHVECTRDIHPDLRASGGR